MFLLFYIALALLFVYGILIAFYERAWNHIPAFSLNGSENSLSRPTVSLIIPARNEAQNIGNCIRSMLAQSYPPELLEIIIINDYSTDETAAIVNGFTDPHIKLVNLSDHVSESGLNSYKKKAIEIGISQALGELIITTDADCTASRDWIRCLAAFYRRQDAAFISAPVRIQTTGTLLSVFQALDFITLQGITGASVYKRFHSMCNGANLAYRKSVFYEVGGFTGIDNIASGDDMLLMHKIAGRYPGKVFYLKNEAAIVSTGALLNWKAFLQQRIRWASKTGKYDDKRIVSVLFLVYILNAILLIFLLAGLWNMLWLLLFLVLIFYKTMVEFVFVRSVAGFFRQQKLMVYFAFLQPLHILYTVIAGWLGRFGNYEWKGRKVK